MFKNIGFALRYHCKNDISAFVTDPTGKSELVKFEAKDNKICARNAGIYKIQADNCYQMKQKEIKIDIMKDVLDLQPLKYRIQGEI